MATLEADEAGKREKHSYKSTVGKDQKDKSREVFPIVFLCETLNTLNSPRLVQNHFERRKRAHFLHRQITNETTEGTRNGHITYSDNRVEQSSSSAKDFRDRRILELGTLACRK